MGRDFTIRGGRRAVDYLLKDVLVRVPANGTTSLGFPEDVEVHPHSFLKTLLEAGVPLEYPFMHHGTRRTLQEVVDGAHALFRPPSANSDPNRLPWALIALSRTTSPLRRRWTNAWGEAVDLDGVVEIALRMLERASLPIEQAMQQNKRLTAQAPVHAFTCGGTHMLYGLLTAAASGYAPKERVERIQRQVSVLVWRLRADVDLIDRFYEGSRATNPKAAWWELDARLKLLGHAEECLAFSQKRGVVTLTPAQEGQRQEAVTSLRRLLQDLASRNLASARALDKDLFKQLIGDACHARHGLTLA